MAKFKFQQIVAALLIAVFSVGTLANTTILGAPAAQEMLESSTVAGVAPAQNDPQIWLGLAAETPGGTITLNVDWNRLDAAVSGLQVYVLTQTQVDSIGDKKLSNNNTAAGNPVPGGSSNQRTLSFKTVGDAKYTLVIANDSTSDAEFVITAKGGVISDGSGQVTDPNATATAESEEAADGEATDDAAAEDDAAVDETATPEATDEEADADADATATPEVAATETVTTTDTTTDTVEATATPEADVMMTEPGVVEAKELKGELPEKDDQHFFALEPSENNGAIELSLLAEPQDNAEISRRLNFWVLNTAGFEKYRDPSNNEQPSNYAIAAGNLDTLTGTSERTASFKASGFGPYTVIVYNNSRVPGTYTLRVDGGILIDDSGQSMTAQMPISGTVASTTTVAAGDTTAAATDDASDADADTDAATTGTREGEPGGTYTVQSGDTLGLIARDIYGQVSVYQAICAFNGIADCNRIEVGDVIRLPTQAEIDANATAPVVAATPEVEATATPEASTEVTTTVEITDTTDVTTTAAITETAAVTSTETTTTTTAPAEGESASGGLTIAEAISSEGSGFSTLAQALERAGLTAALNGPGPLTLFAPTDAAFAALGPGIVDQLPLQTLTDVLLFHVLAGQVVSTDIFDQMEAVTQQGKSVRFEVDGDTVKVNGANIVVKDVLGSNGVIHVIDAVIQPPQE